jgi:hypothetical protein
MKRTPLALLAALLVAVVWLVAACDSVTQPMAPAGEAVSSEALLATSPPRRLALGYVKTESGLETFNWFGNVSGGINGDLETQVTGFFASGHILHIQTVWTVTNASGGKNFIANLDGTLDTNSGKLLLNGAIVNGYLVGARVHDEGVLTGFTGVGGTIFEGSLWIMPGSAD